MQTPAQLFAQAFGIQSADVWEQARAMLQQCLEGEGFYLQIDSHMRFVEDWDALLLKVSLQRS